MLCTVFKKISHFFSPPKFGSLHVVVELFFKNVSLHKNQHSHTKITHTHVWEFKTSPLLFFQWGSYLFEFMGREKHVKYISYRRLFHARIPTQSRGDIEAKPLVSQETEILFDEQMGRASGNTPRGLVTSWCVRPPQAFVTLTDLCKMNILFVKIWCSPIIRDVIFGNY